MGEDDAGIGQEPAPIAGMVRPVAQLDADVEIEGAARAEKDRRPVGAEPWPVRGDQHIAAEPVLVLPAYLAQSGRADLLAGLEEEHGIEPEPPARLQHR